MQIRSDLGEQGDVRLDRTDSNGANAEANRSAWNELCTSEDWWAVWIGGLILTVAFLAVFLARPEDIHDRVEALQRQLDTVRALQTAQNDSAGSAGTAHDRLDPEQRRLEQLRAGVATNPLKSWLTKVQKWTSDPRAAFTRSKGEVSVNLLPSVGMVFVVSLLLFGVGLKAMGHSFLAFARGFVVLFALAVIAYLLANQAVIKHYNLEYPLWALLVGLLISNTIGTPQFVKPAVRTEFYIKTGLVLLGAKILVSRLFALGTPGIFVAWVVTPIVLVSTYAFGQRVLRIGSKSLNMTISADMSVCGVSAAIATAAACRAKKEELSLAIGLSLSFTVVMMTVMPAVIRLCGMSDILGGAWMGGTIDATGAVAAAGAFLGGAAEDVAVTVKMIQNILIGVVAFCVAVYWVIAVEPAAGDVKPSAWEIWYRFPKFVIGFVAASVVFSLLSGTLVGGQQMVNAMIKGTTDVLRGWFFCLAFVSIGLDTNFRELIRYIEGGKPLLLYLVGQSLNLGLTLFMAWLMFEVVFKDSLTTLVR